MNRSVLSMTLVSLALMILLGGMITAHAATKTSFDLSPVNAACLPDAIGHVSVLAKEDTLGADILGLKASGLPANTDFAVFLTSVDAFDLPHFGTVEYIGDFTTNADGIGTLKVRAIINESFVSTLVGDPATRVRVDLDHLVFWFADPNQVPACFNFTTPTPFDGDGNAGPAAMSSVGATGLELLP